MDETRPGNPGEENRGPGEAHIRLMPIEHDEYDALADLFLGGGGLAPDPIRVEAPGARLSVGVDHDDDGANGADDKASAPDLQLRRSDEDAALREPVGGDDDDEAPFRPESAGLRVLESLRETDDRASALMAELLDEDGAADDEVEVVRMPSAAVEVVVLGHLPIRATLWARQYACSLAKARGEVVALVRAAAGSTAVDLITGEEPISAHGSSGLDAALATVSGVAKRVILRVDEASEPELLDRPEVDTITILTGADEAAVVASYRLIKTLDASLGEQFEDEDAPRLKLAVMGAGREQAGDACEKLRNAVETFITRPIEIVVGAGRIDATGTTNIYRDAQAHPAGHIIDGLVRASHDASAGPRGGPEAETDFADVPAGGLETEAPVADGKPAACEIEAKPGAGGPIEAPVTGDPQASAGSVGDKQFDTGRDEGAAPLVGEGLCALIPGLRPIETRCPKAPGVELAVDGKGRLHLLVCDDDTTDAMNRLYAAQNWSRDHLGLLLRAEPGLALPSVKRELETDAMMHLISTEPRLVSEIYDTPVRVYALARVRMGGVIAQVATPLN